MPYGIPISESDRIIRHQSIYGGMPPATRIGIPQEMNTLQTTENLNLILLAVGIGGAWIFIDFILPHLMDK